MDTTGGRIGTGDQRRKKFIKRKIDLLSRGALDYEVHKRQRRCPEIVGVLTLP